MNERPALGVLILVAGFFVGTLFHTPSAFASTAENFLTVEGADVSVNDDKDELTARLTAEGVQIPTDGTEGAFGYGILTDGDTILVAHTHSGILDSEDQRFAEDPIWHTHLVKLGDVKQCGDNQGIVDITWQSPGTVRIDNETVRISGIPTDKFQGWDSITGEPLWMTLGKGVSEVVSFKLKPVFGEEGLEAICVTDIRSAEAEVNID